MSGFKVGEIAIGQNFAFDVDRNGAECEIIRGLHMVRVLYCVTTRRRLPRSMNYAVRWADGAHTYVEPKNLRKRRPPASDGAAYRQAMLDCIERAKWPSEVAA